MPTPTVVRQTAAIPGAVGALRRWVEELCRETGATGLQVSDVALAVSEALSNVVMHAYVDRAEPGVMRISAGRAGDRLLVEVEDEGVGIRPRLDSPGGGLGLALIASLASEVEFGHGPCGRGALVRMTFAL